MSLPWLIGESPSRTGDRYWRFPLSGAPARVLCTCAGWPALDGASDDPGAWTWALYERFRTANVFKRHADASPWRTDVARDLAFKLAVQMYDADAPAVVLLGRKVSAAFGMQGVPFFEWVHDRHIPQVVIPHPLGHIPQVVIPHPSGRNLLINDQRTCDHIGRVLRAAVDMTQTQEATA